MSDEAKVSGSREESFGRFFGPRRLGRDIFCVVFGLAMAAVFLWLFFSQGQWYNVVLAAAWIVYFLNGAVPLALGRYRSPHQ